MNSLNRRNLIFILIYRVSLIIRTGLLRKREVDFIKNCRNFSSHFLDYFQIINKYLIFYVNKIY